MSSDAFLSARFSGLCKLPIPLCEDGVLAFLEAVYRRDVSNCAVKTSGVVIHHEVPDDPPCILDGERRFDSDGLAFQGLVPAFYFPV